jgi:hypothetical protein
MQNEPPLESMRARAEQVRRLVGMTDDPEMAMNLRCCAEGLNADIERLAAATELPQNGTDCHDLELPQADGPRRRPI